MTAKKKVRKKTTKKAATKKTRTKKKVVKKRVRAVAEPIFDEPMNDPEPTWPWPLRPYQQKVADKFDAGVRRFGLFWHRRAGKDITCLSLARREARRRIGGYIHFFPKHVQARRALWRGVDPRQGRNFIDIAFNDYIVDRNNSEMFLEFANGSTWQLLGSDSYDRVVGSNAVGVFFSEWALCDPRAWDFIRPIILENGGFACFITTFRSRNHAWQMAEKLKDNPDWFIDIRGVDKTFDSDGQPIITDAMIQAERDGGMSEALIQQEYYCNPEATSDGAIYGKQVDAIRKDIQRQFGKWNPDKPVYCVWNFDLPVFAAYTMWQSGKTPVCLDADILEWKTLAEALADVKNRRWPIQRHIVAGHNRDVIPSFYDLDTYPLVQDDPGHFNVTSRASSFIERMDIDGDRCQVVLDALAGYVRREKFLQGVSELQFSDQPAESWHWRLASTLETFAAWDYTHGAGKSSKRADYSQQDRIFNVTR